MQPFYSNEQLNFLEPNNQLEEKLLRMILSYHVTGFNFLENSPDRGWYPLDGLPGLHEPPVVHVCLVHVVKGNQILLATVDRKNGLEVVDPDKTNAFGSGKIVYRSPWTEVPKELRPKRY